MSEDRVTLILPCRDESRALRWLLPRIPTGFDAVVVDNGSRDDSVAIAIDGHATVVQNRRSRLLGRSITQAVESSTTDIICVMDGDGTIDPRHIVKLVEPIFWDVADFVVGERPVAGSHRSPTHRMQSRVRDWVLKQVVADWPFSDLGSARAFRRSSLGCAPLVSNERYGWNLDITMHAIRTISPERTLGVALPYGPRIGRSKISASLVGSTLACADHLQVVGAHARWASWTPLQK